MYHAPSSYYSMIARLALREKKLAFMSSKLDIHRKMQQLSPAYVRINPHMTVPTLVIAQEAAPALVLADSRDILDHAFGGKLTDAEPWVQQMYAQPVEELTMGWIMSWNPVARQVFPLRVKQVHQKLLGYAESHPDLAAAYLQRAAVFERRLRTFQPNSCKALFAQSLQHAGQLLDALDTALQDGRSVLVPPQYSPADVAATVLLARLHFVGQSAQIARRKALHAYDLRMRARPSFRAADIWTSFSPFRIIMETWRSEPLP